MLASRLLMAAAQPFEDLLATGRFLAAGKAWGHLEEKLGRRLRQQDEGLVTSWTEWGGAAGRGG